MIASRLLHRLRGDVRGVALIEFAFVVPVFILLLTGGFQISDAVFAYRKVTATTRTIADLTTQFDSVTDADLDTILNASQQVLAPYSTSYAKMSVYQIDIDASGVSKVDWSRGKNITPLAPGTAFSIPAAYRQNGTTLIVAEVLYDYVPTFAPGQLGRVQLRETIMMRPRKSEKIARP